MRDGEDEGVEVAAVPVPEPRRRAASDANLVAVAVGAVDQGVSEVDRRAARREIDARLRAGTFDRATLDACDELVGGAHDDPDERYLFVAECSDGRLVEVLVGVQDPMPDHREAARAEVVARIRRGHFQTWRLGFLDDGDALEAEATGGARAP